MTTLVTGGAGFVGLNVVEALLEHGDDVLLLDAGALPPGCARALEPYAHRLAVECGDVLDRSFVQDLCSRHRVERIVHAAAITSGSAREAADPIGIIEVNLRGTSNVLEAARRGSVRRVIYVGSGAAYGETLYRQSRLYEESPSVPTTLYSITKHAAERMCMRLRELWQLDVVCVRLGTVIGPWERDTGVRDNFGTHSQLAALALAGSTAVLPQRDVQRDWVYARDVAQALVQFTHMPRPRHRLYNVSSGVVWQQPIAEWCAALAAAYGRFSYKVAASDEQPNVWYTDRDRGVMDIGRLVHDVGYSVRYPMTEAYRDYLGWIQRSPEFLEASRPGHSALGR